MMLSVLFNGLTLNAGVLDVTLLLGKTEKSCFRD